MSLPSRTESSSITSKAKPNLFVLGAPKCGTTSLVRWLSGHPQVYVSPRKEPYFFNYDCGLRRCKTLVDYEALFSAATSQQHIVCEASTLYLFSRDAVPAILSYNPEARFVVMLRNPLEMAVSLHEQTHFIGDESESSFPIAWSMQSMRAKGMHIPPGCSEPKLLQYGALCKVGAQLQRLYGHVARERVHLIRLDDLQADPKRTYLKLLQFLAIDDDGRTAFPVHNRAKVRRFRIVWQSIRLINIRWREAGLPSFRVGLTSTLNSWTRKERPRAPIDESLREEMRNYFREDVRLLESLTGWDLSQWLSA